MNSKNRIGIQESENVQPRPCDRAVDKVASFIAGPGATSDKDNANFSEDSDPILNTRSDSDNMTQSHPEFESRKPI